MVADWATDMAHVADALGAERLGVVGLSGGGPYALSCAATPDLAGRVAAVAVLGGVTPTVGPDATCTGAIELARRFAPVPCQAVIDYARLFGRDWGFRLADVKVPVRWWHGDADSIVSFSDAERAATRLPDAELILMPEESHLVGFAAADEVLGFLRPFL
jgi:pimeloyl-ACP methyl ester carboxylesterase